MEMKSMCFRFYSVDENEEDLPNARKYGTVFIPVPHVKKEEMILTFRIGGLAIYRAGNDFWAEILSAQNSGIRRCLEIPTCIDPQIANSVPDHPRAVIESMIADEMVCDGRFYQKVAEPRYYICPNVTWRRLNMTYSMDEARDIAENGLRVFNAFEYEKALEVGNMIRILSHEDSKSPKDVCPPRLIEVLDPSYKPTFGGDPVPGKLLTQKELNKLQGLDLEFRSGTDDYIYNLEDSSAFCGPYEEFCKIVLGDLPHDSYKNREAAVIKHLEMSGDVYARTDDEIEGESVTRIADIIRTCDVREIHYAAAQILGLNEKMNFQMPKTPEESEEEIPFDTIRESVKDYLEFSHETSKEWAFNLTFEQITRQHIDLIAAVAGCCDTEVIYLAADCILGTNPDLLSDPASTDTEETEDEDAGDYGMAMVFTSPRGKTIRFDSWGNSEDEKGNPIYYVGMCCHCHNKYRSILGNRAAKSPSATACYVKGCENNTDYYADFAAEDVTFVEDFETVPGAFEYGCYHFVPVGTFKNKEFNEIVKKLRIDPELGVCTAGYTYPCKVPYSHESFYDASSVKTADVFKCLENGKLYTACQNDLQLYKGEYIALGLEWD